MVEVGSRVGALLDVERGKARLFGYGVYVGDEIPHEKVGGLVCWIRARDASNPKIVLDNGKDVFGCECWWGPEDVVKKMVEGKDVEVVDIDKYRSENAIIGEPDAS